MKKKKTIILFIICVGLFLAGFVATHLFLNSSASPSDGDSYIDIDADHAIDTKGFINHTFLLFSIYLSSRACASLLIGSPHIFAANASAIHSAPSFLASA